MVRRLRVHRKGYHRRGYTRKDGVRVKACYVPPTTYYIKDRGAPGRGRKVLPELREDKMTIEARKAGLLKKGQKIGDLSTKKIVKLAKYLRKKYGQRRAWGMFHAQIVFRKRMPDGFKRKMKIGRDVARGKPGKWD